MIRGRNRRAQQGDALRIGQSSGESVASILLAEDDEAVREFVKRALGHYGHSVTAVSDGGAALAALEETPYDLLLTDIVMPGVDGIALALKATKDRPAMPVVLMTGFGYDPGHSIVKARQAKLPLYGELCKPFRLDQLLDTVERIVRAEDALQPPAQAPERQPEGEPAVVESAAPKKPRPVRQRYRCRRADD